MTVRAVCGGRGQICRVYLEGQGDQLVSSAWSSTPHQVQRPRGPGHGLRPLRDPGTAEDADSKEP